MDAASRQFHVPSLGTPCLFLTQYHFRGYFCAWNSIPSLITVNPFTLLNSVLFSLPLESPHCLLRSGFPAFGNIWGHTFLNNDRTWDTCSGFSGLDLKLYCLLYYPLAVVFTLERCSVDKYCGHEQSPLWLSLDFSLVPLFCFLSTCLSTMLHFFSFFGMHEVHLLVEANLMSISSLVLPKRITYSFVHFLELS